VKVAYCSNRLALDIFCLMILKNVSMGFISGVYWGRVTATRPLFSKNFYTRSVLWMDALSITITSLDMYSL